MTTVGYGDVFAASTFGRAVSMINAIWGAFIISLFVAFIGKTFDLSMAEKHAISEITNSHTAAKSVKSFISYVMMRNDYRADKRLSLQPSYKSYDYVPTVKDLNQAKSVMQNKVAEYTEERISNVSLNLTPVVHKIDTDIDVVKEQVLDI